MGKYRYREVIFRNLTIFLFNIYSLRFVVPIVLISFAYKNELVQETLCSRNDKNLSNITFHRRTIYVFNNTLPEAKELSILDFEVRFYIFATMYLGCLPGGVIGALILRVLKRLDTFVLILAIIILAFMVTVLFLPDFNFQLMSGCQMGIGFFTSIAIPSIRTVINNWMPFHESNWIMWQEVQQVLSAFIITFLYLMLPNFSNYLVLFIIPIIMMISVIVNFYLQGSDSPLHHTNIHEDELNLYLENSDLHLQRSNTPIYDLEYAMTIFTSSYFWIVLLLRMGDQWFFNSLLLVEIDFLKNVFYPVNYITAIAFIFLSRVIFQFCSYTCGWYIDIRRIFPLNYLFLISVIFSHVIPGVLYMTSIQMGCNRSTYMYMVITAASSSGFVSVSIAQFSFIFIKKYEGFIFALLDSLNAICAITIVFVAGFVLSLSEAREHWDYNKFLTGVVTITTGVLAIALIFIKKNSINNKQEL